MKKSIPVLTLLLVSSLYPQVNIDINKLLERGGLLYAPNKEKPFTGSVFDLYDNGQKWSEGTYKYENGQKAGERTYEDGITLSKIAMMVTANVRAQLDPCG
jgi:antitoxin component YwqK of YwqJK toxin-antitoxin module